MFTTRTVTATYPHAGAGSRVTFTLGAPMAQPDGTIVAVQRTGYVNPDDGTLAVILEATDDPETTTDLDLDESYWIVRETIVGAPYREYAIHVPAGTGDLRLATCPHLTTVTGDTIMAQYLSKTANLGDLPDPAVARTNLGLLEAVQDIVGAMVAAADGISVVYNDTAGTLTVSATGGGGALDPNTPVILGDPGVAFSFPVPDPTEGATPYRLVVATQPGETNDMGMTMLVGTNDPTNPQGGLYALSGSGDAVLGEAREGVGVHGQAHGVGTGLKGSNQGGTGPALGIWYGYAEIGQKAEPETPIETRARLYLDPADNVVKIKTSDGIVHPLW